jgi:hypothetical protein
MRLRRTHAGWAVKAWVLGTVFLLPFLGPLEVAGWVAVGGALALLWRALPEEPEGPPPGKLPFHDQYAHRQVPRPGDQDPP